MNLKKSLYNYIKMVINYQLGKVYKIVGNGMIYVGSTCEKYLSNRLAGHNRSLRKFQKRTSNYFTSFECLSDENHYIELLELCPCNSKDELHKCERKWIERLDCVNKKIPTRTDKEYYEDNKDKLLEDKRKYYQDNKEIIKKKRNEYRKNNRDKINEKQNTKYHAKKAIIDNI